MKPALSAILLSLATLASGNEHPLASADQKMGREAILAYVKKGREALPELRQLSQSVDPRVSSRAKEAIGGITGHWGSQVDLIWKRSLKEATGQGKPILLLQLFGNLNEEFC